jgi:hypothetical protein
LSRQIEEVRWSPLIWPTIIIVMFCGSRSSNWQIQSRLQQPDKTQKANVLTSAADLVYILNWDIQKESKPVQKQLFVTLDDDEQKVYDYLLKTGKNWWILLLCVVNFLFIKYQECC